MRIYPDRFYVIAVVSNSTRYLSRIRLFNNFQSEMKELGAKLLVVELAYGNRPYEVTESGNPFHLQLRTQSEIWHKENLINLGVKRLTEVAPDFSAFAFIDADVSFVKSHWINDRRCWITETVHALQHYAVVQMFQNAIDLGPQGEVIGKYDGFAWAHVNGRFNPKSYQYCSYHPGYAWAWRRETYNQMGGLIHTGILGAGDRHMAYGLISKIKSTIHPGLDRSYSAGLYEWEKRAERYCQHNIGYLPMTLMHHYHGSKRRRFYHDRWRILVQNQYNPVTDLIASDQGVLELVVMNDRQRRLRDQIRAYFRSRDEDGIDAN